MMATAISTSSLDSVARLPIALYRNDNGVLVDVAQVAGVADARATLSVAWGDYDADGDPGLAGWVSERRRCSSCIGTTAAASPTSRATLASRAIPDASDSSRGSTTTATATSICSSRFAIAPTRCFEIRMVASPMSRRRSASTIGVEPSAQSGSTSTKTAISISMSATWTATPTRSCAMTAQVRGSPTSRSRKRCHGRGVSRVRWRRERCARVWPT